MRCRPLLFLLLLSSCRVCGAQEFPPLVCAHSCMADLPARACVTAPSPPTADTDAWLLLAALAVCTAGRLATHRRS